MVLVMFAVRDGDFGLHIAARRVDRPPAITVTQRQVDGLAVRGNRLAVGVAVTIMASPDDGVTGQIHAYQLILQIRGNIQLPERNAGRDPLVIARIRQLDLAQQRVTAVDIVDADTGSVGDVQQTFHAANDFAAFSGSGRVSAGQQQYCQEERGSENGVSHREILTWRLPGDEKAVWRRIELLRSTTGATAELTA